MATVQQLADENNNMEKQLSNGKANGLATEKEAAAEEESSFLDIFASLKDEDLIRGDKPEDIEQRCLELCQTYIGGSWNGAKSIDDVAVRRITGGLTNQLYRIELKDSVPRVENAIYKEEEPSVLAIKLYQAKHMKNYSADDAERLNDIIILTILSEVGIGPKVYGIFSDGFIQAFHEHQQFSVKQQQNPKLLRELAHLMARVHHLNVPIRKNNVYWNLDEIKSAIDFSYKNCAVEELIEELDLAVLREHNLYDEYAKLDALIRSITSGKVFCHSDFRSMNVLVTEPDQKILLVDLEYSTYSNRAFDIATFMMEWGQAQFDFKNMGIPEDAPLQHFARLYIEGCDLLVPGYSKNAENSVETIVRETKLYILAQYLFFVSFLMKQQEAFIAAIPFDSKTNMKHVNDIYKKYLEIKQQLIKDGVIEQ